MKGYTPVDIPTQPYIAAFIKGHMGPQPKMNGPDALGITKYFTVLLTRASNYRKTSYRNGWYTTKLRVYIDMHTCNARGHYLNETNVRDFNIFVKNLLKGRFHELMDDYVEKNGSITKSLDRVREKLKISIFDWDDDSMRKDYLRYRKKNGLSTDFERKLSTKVSQGQKDKNN